MIDLPALEEMLGSSLHDAPKETKNGTIHILKSLEQPRAEQEGISSFSWQSEIQCEGRNLQRFLRHHFAISIVAMKKST